ncbi:DNA replication complex GINS protein psf2 [Smittium mucronatum]|uniref:DNA replication complex GINS protein psf2 n=1 Tax=Smittium mucronatum TaxID=133383 RepID=A0A1R0H2B6_9FUNG|nr:DNA replication complex GINS protein psf2 [Smittium mucronatum]
MDDTVFAMEELEFFAETVKVTIQPVSKLPKLDLISGTYGAFHPLRNETVPLWLAILLRRANRCRIVTPAYLHPTFIDAAIAHERRPSSGFAPLPPHFWNVAKLFLEYAATDIGDEEAHEIRRKLLDLRQVRAAKMAAGIAQLDHVQLQMDHLLIDEIGSIKPVFKPGFDQLFVLNSYKSDLP